MALAVVQDDKFDNPLVRDITEKWSKADRALSLERQNYWLNLAFFYGQQWIVWHPVRQEIAEFPRPKDSDRVRLTINRILPSLITTLSKLTKRTLDFEVLPSQVSDDVISGAHLSEFILEAAAADQDWEDIRYEELFNSFIGATSAVCVEWDGTAGEELEVDEDTGRIVGTGDIKLTALSISEFTLEPGTRNAKDARWWCMARAIPPEQVKATFGLNYTPKADSGYVSSPLQRRLWTERGYPTNVDLAVVYTYYERPNRSCPTGRVTTMVGGQILDDRPWPFPFKHLNLYVFRQTKMPMQWTGHTFVNDARPLQAAYNAARSNMAEHMKLAGNARLAVPDTSMDYMEDLTDQPGEIIYYDAQAGSAPHYMEPPNIPRWLIQEADRLSGELDDLMFTHAISRGEAPGDRNSGQALSVLSEKDDTPLGLMAHDQAAGWAYLASMVLELYAAKVPEQRTAQIQTESGMPIVVRWNGKMLRNQTRVQVPLDNVMPHSRVALQAWLTSLAGSFPMFAQQMSPQMLSDILDLPDASMLGAVLDADAAKAQRENTELITGRHPIPEKFDDHAKHIAEHNRMRKSTSYQFGDKAAREALDLHTLAHQRLAEEEAIGQRNANLIIPGAAAIPQAHEPMGSMVPPEEADNANATPPGAGMPALPQPPSGGGGQ